MKPLRPFACCLCLAAMPCAAEGPPGSGVWSVMVENDLFYGSDQNYTSGVALAWVPNPRPAPDWGVRLARAIPWFPDGGAVRHGYTLGQNMYTPKDITLADPPRDDRPYAGFLYGTLGLGVETQGQSDQMLLTLGVVGPLSLAERSQKEIHRLTGSTRPQGWSTQLRNEPAVNLGYQRRWRGVLAGRLAGLEFDVIPHAGGALGNVYTYANAGFTARYGKRLSTDLGPLRIRPSPPGSGYFIPADTFSWYAFVGADGRALARNLFLDGNTFRDSRSVDKNRLVGDLQWGLEFTWQGVRASYTHVRRSREFATQRHSSEFGAFSVSVAF